MEETLKTVNISENELNYFENAYLYFKFYFSYLV